MVEKTGPRLFGLDDREVAARRKYVGDVRKELNVSFCLPLGFNEDTIDATSGLTEYAERSECF